jgi:hypothetical protein
MNELHKQFIREAKVPVPNPMPKFIHLKTSYWYSHYFPQGNSIFLLPTDWESPFAFYHELGHAYDQLMLTKQDRIAIARIIGHPGLRWWWGTWNPLKHARQPNMENFADWYSECAQGADGPQHKKLRKYLYEKVRVTLPN